MTKETIIDVSKQFRNLQVQYDKVVEQNRQWQAELREKTAECEELKNKLMQKDEVNAFFNTPTEGWSSDPCAICESKNEYPRYKQALDDIEVFCNTNDFYVDSTAWNIFKIIKAAKEGEE